MEKVYIHLDIMVERKIRSDYIWAWVTLSIALMSGSNGGSNPLRPPQNFIDFIVFFWRDDYFLMSLKEHTEPCYS